MANMSCQLEWSRALIGVRSSGDGFYNHGCWFEVDQAEGIDSLEGEKGCNVVILAKITSASV